MDQIYATAPHAADVWRAMAPDGPVYSYDGVSNMNSMPGLHGRIERILRANEVRAIARPIGLVEETMMRKISRGPPGRSKECQVRPIDDFGVVADFSTNEAAPAGRGPTHRLVLAQSDLEKIGDVPAEEPNLIPRHNFPPRGVTAAGMRDAILSLERATPTDTIVAATIAMFRIAYPNRERRAKYTSARTLAAALMLSRLHCTGRKAHLVERISNAFAINPPAISIAVDMDGESGGLNADRAEGPCRPDGRVSSQ